MKLLKLTPGEFKIITRVIYDHTGISLPETKLTLLSNRLRKRLQALELHTFKEYHSLISDHAKCQSELPHFLSAVTTNETYFFRNENLWKFIRKTWIPDIVKANVGKQTQSLRFWSAASSSGEEAYTMAICLREAISNINTWRIELIGSDISERMLERARTATYNDYAVSKTTQATLTRWFIHEDNAYTLKPEVRKMVTFRYHNLRDAYPNTQFDLIFLRNVLMYFDTPMKLQTLETVTNALAPGGHLYVGDVDPIRNTAELNQALKLDHLGPNIYRKPTQTPASVRALS